MNISVVIHGSKFNTQTECVEEQERYVDLIIKFRKEVGELPRIGYLISDGLSHHAGYLIKNISIRKETLTFILKREK